MKVLRIYDHLGILKKEFPVYVEGNDFKWEASVPEVIWLGTIALCDFEVMLGAEPTPEAEAEVIEPEVLERAEQMRELISEPEPEPEPEVKQEEVNHEPKAVHGKRSRVKRAKASSDDKSTKAIPQGDNGGNAHKRNKGS